MSEEFKNDHIKQVDIEQNPLPYNDNYFDVVYSKSLIEHLWEPDNYLNEANRILKPGGKIITLVPDWEVQFKTYFDDFTHRTPFTKVSLNDIYLMSDYENIRVIKFRQLPIVWRLPFLNLFCAVIAPLVPIRTSNKFFKHSRELMLIGYGEKHR